MWQQLFVATNIVALIGWVLLLAAPARSLPLVRYGAVALLCAIYAALFIGLTSGLLDPVRAPGVSARMTDYSVAGLRALFASDGAIVVGWTHYLAFDLFVGAWITEDADRHSVSRWLLAPILVAIFLAGPIGLILYYGLTARRRMR